VDVWEVVRSELGVVEFVAACLYGRHVQRGSLEHLLKSAFEALDADRDGLVHIDEIRTMFRERDAPFLERLPQNHPFDLSAWCSCLQTNQDSPTRRGCGPSHQRVPSGGAENSKDSPTRLAAPVTHQRVPSGGAGGATANFNAYEAQAVPLAPQAGVFVSKLPATPTGVVSPVGAQHLLLPAMTQEIGANAAVSTNMLNFARVTTRHSINMVPR